MRGGSPARQLATIQAARGAAAIAVVLAHAGTVLGSSEALGAVPMHGVFRAGHAGVDFFFVLSGFIIAFMHHEAIYLVHFPAIAALLAVLIDTGAVHAVPGAVVMTVLAVSGVAAGVALHLVAERPILRWLRSATRITVEGTHHAARETA